MLGVRASRWFPAALLLAVVSLVVPSLYALDGLQALALHVLEALDKGLAAPQAMPPIATGSPRTVILPQQLIAGAQATLAVLDAKGRLVPAVDLKLSGAPDVTTDSTGRATFLAPATPGIFNAEITENGLAVTTIVVAAPADLSGDSTGPSDSAVTPAGAPSIVFPSIVSLRDRFALEGRGFSGDARRDRVLLAGLPTLVLAASPVSLVQVPDPRTPSGPAKLAVTVGDLTSEPVTVTVVSLDVTGPETPLAAGEKSLLTVAVRGSRERLQIEVRNFSPEVVSLMRDNIQRVMTGGGESNAARIEIQGVTPGDYSVSAHMVSGTAMLTGVETARQRLLAAMQFANGKWLAALTGVVEYMDRDPQNVVQIRRDIERLIRDRPQGEVSDLLKLAWQALGGE
jgi:hypothetical protein